MSDEDSTVVTYDCRHSLPEGCTLSTDTLVGGMRGAAAATWAKGSS